MKALRILRDLRVLAVLAACLLVVSACIPKKAKPTPPEPAPSTVITQDGMAYYVKGLRLPGTRQELRLKLGDTLTWVPLEQISVVRFTGPVLDTYRQAVISLTNGGQLQGEVNVNTLIEGTSDLGYWNMPLRKVVSLSLAFD